MAKKIMYSITALLCVCMMLLPTFESKASNVYYAAINEPCKSDTQGYLLLEMRNNSTGVYSFDIWFWDVVAYDKNSNSNASSEDVSAYMDISIGSNYVDFVPSAVPYGAYFDCSISVSYGTTCYQWWHSEYESTSDSLRYSANGYTVTGYSYYGNVGNFSVSTSSNNAPHVVWADDKTIVEKISEVKTSIISLNSNITAQANNIISKLGYTNECLDELKVLYEQLIEEQEKSNTWLEKIFDWLNETKEEERQEVQTQGSSSVSQGSDSIENSGQGFGDSLSGLTSSLSYSGTKCSWTFPEVKMPRIAGVIEERVLIPEQEIDFGRWIDAIPSNILLLIRSVLTGALIIYCFKELYGTISYVLTLKGSGVNE